MLNSVLFVLCIRHYGAKPRFFRLIFAQDMSVIFHIGMEQTPRVQAIISSRAGIRRRMDALNFFIKKEIYGNNFAISRCLDRFL